MSKLRTIYRLNLISKNNKERGSYFYSPILKIMDKYFYCRSIKSDHILRPDELNPYELQIIREIPLEFYKANNIKIAKP